MLIFPNLNKSLQQKRRSVVMFFFNSEKGETCCLSESVMINTTTIVIIRHGHAFGVLRLESLVSHFNVRLRTTTILEDIEKRTIPSIKDIDLRIVEIGVRASIERSIVVSHVFRPEEEVGKSGRFMLNNTGTPPPPLVSSYILGAL